MPIDLNISNPWEAIKNVTRDEIIHKEYNSGAFIEFDKDLIPAFNMTLQIGQIIDRNIGQLPSFIVNQSYVYADELKNQLDYIINYDVLKESKKPTYTRSNVSKRGTDLGKDFLSEKLSNTQISFLDLYNFLKAFESENLESSLTLANEMTALRTNVQDRLASVTASEIKYNELIEKVEKTTEELNRKSSEKVIDQYAKIFENQSTKHYKASFIWLGSFAFALLAFLYLLPKIDNYLPLPNTDNATILALEYVRRLLVVSFGIFILTFLLRQYTVEKHLETLNKHRQNVFNSFELFVNSLSNAEADVRHSLMVEVARAIAESGQTGYINFKDDGGNNSITEITKYLKKDV